MGPQDLAEPLHDLPRDIDVVVHLAHSGAKRSFPEDVEDVTLVNVLATVRLLDLCRRRGARFVFGSSGAVYAPGPRPHREEDAPQPPSFYGDSKLAGERAVLRFSELIDVSVLRFFFIYGPGQSQGFMADLVDRVRTGRPVRLGGPNGIRVNPVFID